MFIAGEFVRGEPERARAQDGHDPAPGRDPPQPREVGREGLGAVAAEGLGDKLGNVQVFRNIYWYELML